VSITSQVLGHFARRRGLELQRLGVTPQPAPEPSVSANIDHTSASVLVGSNDWANISYLPSRR